VVVLHFTENRQFTDVFQKQVERELRDGLQAAYGDLARVEVTARHPRLGKVLEKGLGRLEEALAGWNDDAARSAKTHFVFFDFADGEYRIEARQFDGPSGQVTPVVRTDRKSSDAFVARAAALMVDRDFGLVGTFASWPRDGKENSGPVTLELQGAGLGVPLSRWVKKGDVFSAVWMPAGGGPGQTVPFALVQVQEPPDDSSGTCAGRLFWRYLPPTDSGGGYRCLRLGAGKETLRLRFITQPKQGAPFQPAGNVGVEVRRHGFTGENQSRPHEGRTETVTGYYTPNNPAEAVFDRVAFVTARPSQALPPVRIPVPLLDGRPVVIPVDTVRGVGDLTTLRARYWAASVAQSCLVQTRAFEEIGKLAEERKREEAVKRAKDSLARTRDDVARLERAREEICTEAQEAGGKVPDLSKQDELIKKLKTGEVELKGFLDRQDEIDKVENNPEAKAAREQFENGKLLEKQLETDKAIAAYEAAIKGGLDDPKLRAYVDNLKAQWQIKGSKHQEARSFIYNVWPTLDTAGLEREMKKARESFDECKRVGDVITPRKLELEAGKHAARLEEEFNKLRADLQYDQEKEAQRIQKVSEELGRLAKEVADYLNSQKSAAAPAPAPAPGKK
jgi:hypothetical protein